MLLSSPGELTASGVQRQRKSDRTTGSAGISSTGNVVSGAHSEILTHRHTHMRARPHTHRHIFLHALLSLYILEERHSLIQWS